MKPTIEFGLIGQKLGHSFSKAYFTEKFHSEHRNAIYENFELASVGEFEVLRAQHPHLRGLNVTIPYKETIMPLLDAISPDAQAVGAVNTILFAGGIATGYNTDLLGFRESLAEWYDRPPGGKALVLGTGGASKAVQYVLRHYFEFEAIEVASRHPKKGQVSYKELSNAGLGGYALIVNCTPVGMFPDVQGVLPLPFDTLRAESMVFDLIYNPKETKLLEEAQMRGCPTQNGWDMLLRQAEASFAIWMEGFQVI
jgi:shikimate dehydrogenase